MMWLDFVFVGAVAAVIAFYNVRRPIPWGVVGAIGLIAMLALGWDWWNK